MSPTGEIFLSCEHVTRTFDKGRFVAVDDVSLDVRSGEIHSIIGPNGAGKTTLLKMVATVLNPNSGRIVVTGHDTVKSPSLARKEIGLVLGGELGFYPRATARQNLRFFADVAGVPLRSQNREIDRVLQAVDLADRANSKVNSFSRGMTGRLHIARALLGQPKVVIMDEPTNGLDPDIAITIRALIKNLANVGQAVVLTSHTMSEIEDLSSRISLIGAGKLHLTGTLADVTSYAGISVTSTFSLKADQIHLLDKLESAERVKQVDKTAKAAIWDVQIFWRQGVDITRGQSEIRALFEQAGFAAPIDLVSRPATLEEAYVSLAGELKR